MNLPQPRYGRRELPPWNLLHTCLLGITSEGQALEISEGLFLSGINLSPPNPGFIGRADQRQWSLHRTCCYLHPATVERARFQLFFQRPPQNSALIKVSQTVTELLWLCPVSRSNIQHLPLQKMMGRPCLMTGEMTHFYHSPLRHNCVPLWPWPFLSWC